MEASSKHPCLYCIAESQTITADTPRTIGNIRKDYEAWSEKGGTKSKCKLFNKVRNYPLFESLPAEIPTLRITPPPGLHIMTGPFNHIYGRK